MSSEILYAVAFTLRSDTMYYSQHTSSTAYVDCDIWKTWSWGQEDS